MCLGRSANEKTDFSKRIDYNKRHLEYINNVTMLKVNIRRNITRPIFKIILSSPSRSS